MHTTAPATTILLIDANKRDREYWAEQLRLSSPDCVILEAQDAWSGLAICKSQRVDCVVLEMHLPDMSGFQLLMQLNPQARYPQRAVIVLSHFVLPSIIELAKKLGAQSYLLKAHSTGDELNTAIQNAITSV